MKLHLGCGNLYLPDAWNLDKYDLRVAEVQADALRLPVRSDSCDSVVAYHVFEHLGYTGAVYALAESFRVLKPGGGLELETPDPERSFQAFFERSKPMWRAGVLTWIFGEEISGMGHRGLFPKELLEKLVKDAGFSDLKFTEPKTHRHRWGLRLIARKGTNPASRLISLLRPVLISDILNKANPQEALEIEIRLWAPLYRLAQGLLSKHEVENLLLEWTVIVPKVILLWSQLSQYDESLPKPPSPFDLSEFCRVARSLIEVRLCSVLRDAFSALCATVNQVADGYEYLLASGKGIAKKWLDNPPPQPDKEILNELEACGVKLKPDINISYPGDLEVASGQKKVESRKPSWPCHDLFTREHLIERTNWFRDFGIRCFNKGKIDEARRLFRLAINSKMEGLYPVWNMARLQAALGHRANAEIFYKAALGFAMPDNIKDQILSELHNCTSGKMDFITPVSVGEGNDRVFGFLDSEGEEGIDQKGAFPGIKQSRESGPYPPPKTILWEITLRCQCRCTHCAAAGGEARANELTLEEALGVCDQIAELGIPSVCLMGGEPLLHPHWERIALRLKEHGLDLGLTTNSIALDSQTWLKLEDLGFSQVVISLDGASPEVHDTRRRRKGALKAAQNAIREMVSRSLRFRTVVTSVDKNNIGELSHIRDWLLENAQGITWMVNFASPTSGGRLDKKDSVGIEEFLSLVQFIAENREKYKDHLDITGTHCMGYFSQKYKNLHNYIWSGCQAGITTLGLRSDGAITGCLIMSDYFIEGNLRQLSLYEIWNDPGSFTYNRHFSVDMLKGKCRSCRWGETCRGGCREAAFSFLGGFFEPPFCLYHLESTGVIS